VVDQVGNPSNRCFIKHALDLRNISSLDHYIAKVRNDEEMLRVVY